MKHMITGIFFLLGCAQPNAISIFSIDPELEPYYQRFIEEAANQGVYLNPSNLQMRFTDKYNSTNVLGTCTMYQGIIQIAKDKWVGALDSNKEQLIFHELGHCLLHRGHDDRWTMDKNVYIEESVMNSYRLDYMNYEIHRDYYIHELFHPNL